MSNFTSVPSPDSPTNGFETSFSPGQIIIIVGIIKLILLALFQSFRSGQFKCDSCCGLCGIETSVQTKDELMTEVEVVSSKESGINSIPEIHIHMERSRGDSDPIRKVEIGGNT